MWNSLFSKYTLFQSIIEYLGNLNKVAQGGSFEELTVDLGLKDEKEVAKGESRTVFQPKRVKLTEELG